MFAWTRRGGSHTAERRLGSRRSNPGGVFAALAIALMVGACTGVAATPSPTPAATPSWMASLWPTGNASPSLAALESALASPTAAGSPGVFALVMGQAGRVAPDMNGVGTAGSQIDDFGFDLLRRLDATGNSCASPTSIALALAMVRPGARGTMASQMDEVLHSFGAPGQEARIAALLQLLNSQTYYDDSDWVAAEPSATPDHTNKVPVVTLNVSDQVFSQQGMTLLPDYLNALQLRLRGRRRPARLQDGPRGRPADHQPVGQPEHRRPHTGDPAGGQHNSSDADRAGQRDLPQSRMDPPLRSRRDNQPAVHDRRRGQRLGAHDGRGAVAELRGGQRLSGRGAALRRQPLAPVNAGRSPGRHGFVRGRPEPARLGQIDALEQTYAVDLTLPRFSANTRVDLVKTLQAMGMTDLFDDNRADLSGITTAERLVISNVIHQANIDVVEEGTTAAAATALIGMATAGPEGPPHVVFHVDRPFLYFIRERTSGAVLFMGRINDPSLKG